MRPLPLTQPYQTACLRATTSTHPPHVLQPAITSGVKTTPNACTACIPSVSASGLKAASSNNYSGARTRAPPCAFLPSHRTQAFTTWAPPASSPPYCNSSACTSPFAMPSSLFPPPTPPQLPHSCSNSSRASPSAYARANHRKHSSTISAGNITHSRSEREREGERERGRERERERGEHSLQIVSPPQGNYRLLEQPGKLWAILSVC
jgi:hypothetical protein